MTYLALPEFALRIACAFALGALIGFERRMDHRKAENVVNGEELGLAEEMAS